MKNSILIALCLLLAGCESASFALVNLPVHFGSNVIIEDIPYGAETHQKLNIHLPQESAKKPHDVIVFFYGGRWTHGTKEDYRFMGDRLAREGFLVVIPDYAKYPQVTFPKFVADGAKALAFVHKHIAEYQGDAERIFVVGHSAGAHIGAMLAADERFLAAEGKTPAQVIAAFIGLAGPYAFTPDEPDLQQIFPKPYHDMQVPNFLSGDEPPMLLLWGDEDEAVGKFNLDRLMEKIKETGGIGQSIIYPERDHIDLMRDFTWVSFSKPYVLPDILRFMETGLKKLPPEQL